VSDLRKDLASSRASHDVHVVSVPIVVVAEVPVEAWDRCSILANSDSSDMVSKKRNLTALGCDINSRRDRTMCHIRKSAVTHIQYDALHMPPQC
jgi:hypothetical protein